MTKSGSASKPRIQVRMLFAEEGGYHAEIVSLPGAGFDEYDRLIDFLREDPAVLKECYVDVGRLCAAQIADEDE